MVPRPVAAALLAAVLAAGCGPAASLPAEPPAPDEPAAATVPPAAARYLEGFAATEPAAMAAMTAAAEPGSPAERYAAFQIAQAEVLRREGEPLPPQDVRPADGGVDVCDTLDGAELCLRFAAFEGTDALRAFTIDGVPIAGRLAEPVAARDADGTRIGLRAAYQSIESGELVAILEVTPGPAADEQALHWPDARYAVAGEELGPVEVLAVPEGVGPEGGWQVGVADLALLVFEAAAPGGTLRVPLAGADGSAATVELPVVPLAG